jgi:undecaprenyl-phosphate 4-deoxy-4-formamido-L-arabinose transferase
VVVPCYRSERTLAPLVERLVEVLAAAAEAYEVLLVVDGSPDGTWPVAARLAARFDTVTALRLARNYGQHNALVAGIRAARYELTVTMDDDLQHPPDEVPALVAALTDDLDLVYGVPAEEEHGIARNLASRTVKRVMSSALGVSDAKSISAFRVFRTFLREGFDGLRGPHACVDVALSWATTRISAVTVRMDQRTEGRSNYTPVALVRHAVTMLTGYSTAPLRLVAWLGAACGLFGLALLGVILVMFATGRTSVPGFTTIASMVALFSGAQMLAIGVLGEYVGRLHSGNLGRPTYVVRERTGLEDEVKLFERAVPITTSRAAART